MEAVSTKKFLSSCILVFASIMQLTSQQSPANALKKLYDDYPQEKIYTWFNKPAYVAGETIWFKAYIFLGYEISFISTSLHVELYDAEKKLISNKLFPVVSGVAEGTIDLGNKLNEGIYYVRAYTQWMLNFDESSQYIHALSIYNPASSKHLLLNESLWKAGAFPEGGSLIEGIKTKVAVRRYATAPLPTKWGGFLFDEGNPTVRIKEFTSLDENAALFTFIPEARKKYYVNVSDELGNLQQYPLPLVRNDGVSISIEETSDSITYKLNFQGIPGNGNGYTVVGEIQHQLVYLAELKKTSPELLMKIPTGEMNNGILHLTVFDPSNHPVAQRLVFVNHHKLAYDSNAVSQQIVSGVQRSASEIQINVDSISWITYAVSVSESTAISSVQEENILSALWLTGDITTALQNPANYFKSPDKNKAEALDAIMISEKWTRFNWPDIINNKYPIIRHIPYHFLSYTGRVSKGKTLKPKEEVSLMLYYPDSTVKMMLAKTDSVGNIVLNDLAFYDDLKVFYQLNNKKNNANSIDIDFERHDRFVPYSLPFPQTSYVLTGTVTDNSNAEWINKTIHNLKMQREIEDKYKTLEEVVVQSKLKTAKDQLNEELSSSLFRTMNETIFDFVNENQTAIAYTNILPWLQGRVAGLSVRYENGNYVAYIRGSRAALYVDEMPADPQLVSVVSVSDIAMVKVIKGPVALVIGGGTGIVAIYTKRGHLPLVQKEPSMPYKKIKGYDMAKKFFLPDYENKTTPQPLTDTRDQLLWQTLLVPDVTADRATVRFFNNDKAKQFRVVVQGFTYNGFPVYYEKIIDPSQRSF